jgi:hypothetical protein
MFGVSAISSNNVWALASYADAQNVNHTSAARWNGSTWSLVPIPTLPLGATLYDLVAISGNDVWVVGSTSSQTTLTMHWNGSQWSVIPSPNGDPAASRLNAVDASSSNNVWAVGSSAFEDYGVGLAMRWDGIQWTLTTLPMKGTETALTEVAVTSPTSVWAGGYIYTPALDQILLYWDGTNWTSAISNDAGAISGIGVISLTDVWASVESYGAPAFPHFVHSNGSQWTTVSSQGLQLGEIEPISSNDIWAVAQDARLHWDGTSWGRVDFPGASFSSLAAISSSDVWAVGATRLPSTTHMLALHYTPACIPTPIPSITPTPIFSTPIATSTPVPPRCPGERFTDVCPGDPFYPYIQALADDGILSGYSTSPPCPNNLWIPCFLPNNSSSRGQIAKVVSLAANFTDPVTTRTFEDVPPGSTFYTYTERLATRGILSGYPCGSPGEPCVPPENRPYFRTNRPVTRGQLSKMVALSFNWNDPVTGQQFQDVPPGSTFYEYIARLYMRGILVGYPCGTIPTEPCVPPENRPYFRPNSNVTRGQTAKIVDLSRNLPTPTPTPTGTPTSEPTSTPTSTGTPPTR